MTWDTINQPSRQPIDQALSNQYYILYIHIYPLIHSFVWSRLHHHWCLAWVGLGLKVKQSGPGVLNTVFEFVGFEQSGCCWPDLTSNRDVADQQALFHAHCIGGTIHQPLQSTWSFWAVQNRKQDRGLTWSSFFVTLHFKFFFWRFELDRIGGIFVSREFFGLHDIACYLQDSEHTNTLCEW